MNEVRRGNTAAYGTLWGLHAPAARRFARTLTKRFDADDLVSDAYLKILLALQNGKGPSGAFRPYLFVTIRNTAVSWAKRDREGPLDDAESIPDPRETDASVLAALDRNLTTQAFLSLPDRWQEILWLTEVVGLSSQEVGARLDMPPNSVSALAYRAREGLRQAWIQAHIDASDTGTEHHWTLTRVGRWARNALSRRNAVRFDEHIRACEHCAVIANEAKATSALFTAITLPVAAVLFPAAAIKWAVPSDSSFTAVSPTFARSLQNEAASSRRARHFTTLAVGTAAALMTVGVAAGLINNNGSTEPNLIAGPSARTDYPTSSRSPNPTVRAPGASTVPGPEEAHHSKGVLAFTSIDTHGGAAYPVVRGVASPHAVVQLSSRNGVLSAVEANADGRWKSLPLQRFPTGNAKVTASSRGESISAPVPISAPAFSTSFNGSALTVKISGLPHTQYQVVWDDRSVCYVRANAKGNALCKADVAPQGAHRVGVRVSETGRAGPMTSLKLLL